MAILHEAISEATRARREAPALTKAVAWIREGLESGAMPYQKLARDAKAEGISKGTLRRAKRRLGIKSVKVPGGWQWALPIQGAHGGRVACAAHLDSESPLPTCGGGFQGFQERTDALAPRPPRGWTIKEMARMAEVSPRIISQAILVEKRGVAELGKAIEDGKMSMNKADKIARLPAEKQREAVAAHLAGQAKR